MRPRRAPSGRHRRRRPGRACRRRSIWRSAACRSCCSTMPTGSARARAASAIPSARWKSSTGSASASGLSRKGVTWKLGKVFLGDELLYSLRSAARGRPQDAGLHQSAAILSRKGAGRSRAASCENLDLRWSNRVTGIERRNDGAHADDRNAGRALPARRRLADCRRRRALDDARRCWASNSQGDTFEDKFLIADVHMAAEIPDRAPVLVRSAIPFRPIGPDAPPAGRRLAHRSAAWSRRRYRTRSRSRRRVRAAHSTRCWAIVDFELEWVSIYTFNCRRLDRFVHGRVIFVGDAAHQVSPFGARGANSGIQDAENLAWKLAAVLAGAGAASA